MIRRDSDRHLLFLPQMKLQNIIDATQVSEHTDGGPAILAEGFDDAVALNAVRLGRACH